MGNWISLNFPPKAEFSVDQIPDLTGQVMIVTGANTGVGKAIAQELLKHNAKVYIAARSQEKAEAAIKELKTKTGKEAIFLKLDLSDLRTIKPTVEKFLSKETQLHVLINNAGVGQPPKDMLTAQGFDLQFGTNTLGHFYFTMLLLPTLISTAKATPGNKGKVRVVNVSSYAHHSFPKMKYETFKDGPERSKMSKMSLYGQSKTGNILFSNELAKRYGDQGIVSISVHPGNIRSDFNRHAPALLVKLVSPLILYPIELGVLTPLYAATAPECAQHNGRYLTAWARYVSSEPDPKTRDPADAKALWDYMEEQVKDY
ncbi:NAD(P)-binding protein [Gymnopus androsaceus JB14]|uniref:NAD(P)-binding protein n=1 Tax=Gymnopus androsaceus JB14 TaxID=1447944 RepID=A0A6A4GY98_9AGAR|nr:NAD(P)-binding protein [Gymnopus androsaceus JB14]